MNFWCLSLQNNILISLVTAIVSSHLSCVLFFSRNVPKRKVRHYCHFIHLFLYSGRRISSVVMEIWYQTNWLGSNFSCDKNKEADVSGMNNWLELKPETLWRSANARNVGSLSFYGGSWSTHLIPNFCVHPAPPSQPGFLFWNQTFHKLSGIAN